MENKKIYAACLLIGLVFLGAMLPTSVSKFRAYDRTVTVKGLSEREVAADKVIWPLSFNVVGNDLNAVYSEIERNTAAIREFLLDGGISEAEISVSIFRLRRHRTAFRRFADLPPARLSQNTDDRKEEL